MAIRDVKCVTLLDLAELERRAHLITMGAAVTTTRITTVGAVAASDRQLPHVVSRFRLPGRRRLAFAEAQTSFVRPRQETAGPR